MSDQGNSQFTKKLQRQFKQVHRNRRVIEGLFSATVLPSVWSQPRLNRLQEEMFKTERGLELLIEAAAQLSTQLKVLPDDVLQVLKDGLEKLEVELWNVASRENQAQLLSDAGERLQSQVKLLVEKKLPEEVVQLLLRIGMAARQLSRSVAEIHTIEIAWLSVRSMSLQ